MYNGKLTCLANLPSCHRNCDNYSQSSTQHTLVDTVVWWSASNIPKVVGKQHPAITFRGSDEQYWQHQSTCTHAQQQLHAVSVHQVRYRS